MRIPPHTHTYEDECKASNTGSGSDMYSKKGARTAIRDARKVRKACVYAVHLHQHALRTTLMAATSRSARNSFRCRSYIPSRDTRSFFAICLILTPLNSTTISVPLLKALQHMLLCLPYARAYPVYTYTPTHVCARPYCTCKHAHLQRYERYGVFLGPGKTLQRSRNAQKIQNLPPRALS